MVKRCVAPLPSAHHPDCFSRRLRTQACSVATRPTSIRREAGDGGDPPAVGRSVWRASVRRRDHCLSVAGERRAELSGLYSTRQEPSRGPLPRFLTSRARKPRLPPSDLGSHARPLCPLEGNTPWHKLDRMSVFHRPRASDKVGCGQLISNPCRRPTRWSGRRGAPLRSRGTRGRPPRRRGRTCRGRSSSTGRG